MHEYYAKHQNRYATFAPVDKQLRASGGATDIRQKPMSILQLNDSAPADVFVTDAQTVAGAN